MRNLKNLMLTIFAAAMLAACAEEKAPPFVFDDATMEEKMAYVQRQVSYLEKYVPKRVLQFNSELHKVKGFGASKQIEIQLRCTMGSGWDCKAPKKYYEVLEERRKVVCRIYRHMSMSRHNFKMKWVEQSKNGGTILALSVDRNKCKMAKQESA